MNVPHCTQPPLSWSKHAIERVAASATARLRGTSTAYGAVDATLVETRISGFLCALDFAVRDGSMDRFQADMAVALRQRLACGFAPRDVLVAVDEVERAVEQLIVEHEAPHAVGGPGWRMIQRTLRRAERSALVGGCHASSAATRVRLAPREREVLALLAEGMRTQDVADRLSLSPFTVRTYVERSMEKLGAATRTHAVAIAVAGGAL